MRCGARCGYRALRPPCAAATVRCAYRVVLAPGARSASLDLVLQEHPDGGPGELALPRARL